MSFTQEHSTSNHCKHSPWCPSAMIVDCLPSFILFWNRLHTEQQPPLLSLDVLDAVSMTGLVELIECQYGGSAHVARAKLPLNLYPAQLGTAWNISNDRPFDYAFVLPDHVFNVQTCVQFNLSSQLQLGPSTPVTMSEKLYSSIFQISWWSVLKFVVLRGNP